MESRDTYHSQLKFIAQVQAWGENPVQQREENMGQHKLQVSMVRTSSR
jgi:hypothetical protein